MLAFELTKHAFAVLLVYTACAGCTSNQTPTEPEENKRRDSRQASSTAVQLLPPDEQVEQPEPLDITFDDLDFAIGKHESFKNSMLTDNIQQLEGKAVRISGLMMPPFVRHGLNTVALIRNIPHGYGVSPLVDEVVFVRLVPGTTTSYSGFNRIDVEGEFSIKPFLDDETNQPLSVYQISNATVKHRSKN